MEKARLEELYDKARIKLKDSLGLKNIMEVPRVSKVVLNAGVKGADSKVLKDIEKTFTLIAGQKPIRTRARKSIAGFKLREGMVVGAKVTLRRRMMYEFLDRLIGFTLPKVRDFQGVPPRFDKSGNYNLGIKEWSVFPELDKEVREKAHGLNITIHTTARNAQEALALLKELGMPFKEA